MEELTKDMECFIYLLENYAAYKHQPANEVLKTWDDLNISDTIYRRGDFYHCEAMENAFRDIDTLIRDAQPQA